MQEKNVNYEMIATRIREIRKQKNYSQMELADKADIAVPFMSQIETGAKKPSLTTLIALANALDVTVNDFLSGNQSITENDYVSDIMIMIEDCSAYEKRVIVKLMNATKEILRSSEKFYK